MLKVATKTRQHVASPACRALFTSSGCRVIIAAIPPANAYAAQTNARTRAKDPNTSKGTVPLSRPRRAAYILLFGVAVEVVVVVGVAVPPGDASYFDAHFACTCSATKRPSLAGRPSTSACDLSI